VAAAAGQFSKPAAVCEGGPGPGFPRTAGQHRMPLQPRAYIARDHPRRGPVSRNPASRPEQQLDNFSKAHREFPQTDRSRTHCRPSPPLMAATAHAPKPSLVSRRRSLVSCRSRPAGAAVGCQAFATPALHNRCCRRRALLPDQRRINKYRATAKREQSETCRWWRTCSEGRSRGVSKSAKLTVP
jgi:hypothetical protein